MTIDKLNNICYTWIKSSKYWKDNKSKALLKTISKKHLTKNKYHDILETSQEQINTWQKRVQSLAHFTPLHSGNMNMLTP